MHLKLNLGGPRKRLHSLSMRFYFRVALVIGMFNRRVIEFSKSPLHTDIIEREFEDVPHIYNRVAESDLRKLSMVILNVETIICRCERS